METKWTPGPWSIDTEGSCIDITAKAKDPETGEEYDAVIAEWVSGSDATLIAAAPELYEALELATQMLGNCTFSTMYLRGQYVDRKETVSTCAAALRKARGEG